MQVIRLILIFLGLSLLGGCIYEYNPDLRSSDNALVINGKVTDQEGYQYIEISRSTAPYDPGNVHPLSGYTVEIQDDEGNSFPGTEMEPGLYRCWIDQEYLAPGISYRLIVTDKVGSMYVSDYDELLPCPDIDSISYESQEKESDIPGNTYLGLQFFVNTDGSGEYAKNFLWELEETWEYHAIYEIAVIYDGRIHDLDEIIYDYFYCWQSKRIPNIYTFSTQNLTSGQIRNYPLHYVSNQSERLGIKYSTLVKQFSLSPEAFEFWNILDKQSKQSGELYETQPAQIIGNIHSQEDGGEPVLGLFYATSVKEKRIFVSPAIEVLRPNCDPLGLSTTELNDFLGSISPNQYPIYLYFEDQGLLRVYDYAEQECFDCRKRGGITERPDFWE
jgi:hypothetical protein